MYLLNPKAVEKENVSLDKFTFHYVSIKSEINAFHTASTRSFTFHYVSIKSKTAIIDVMHVIYLHSTMYLLNLT